MLPMFFSAYVSSVSNDAASAKGSGFLLAATLLSIAANSGQSTPIDLKSCMQLVVGPTLPFLNRVSRLTMMGVFILFMVSTN